MSCIEEGKGVNLLWYWMLDPPRGGFVDKGADAAFTHVVKGPQGQVLDASLYLDGEQQPLFVRVRAFHAADIYDTARFLDLVEVSKEHMLSVLKMSWHRGASFVPLSFFSQEAEDGSGASIEVQWPSVFEFDSKMSAALFEHTIGHRQSLRLLVDGLDERVPLQYRFLSLYKFLEIRYRDEKDHWDFRALASACQVQLEAFSRLGIGRTLQAELKHLRDRCAHIRSGSGKKRRMGVTALNPEAQKEVARLMPLLVEICRNVFNSEMDGKVVFNDLRSWGERVFADNPTPGSEAGI